MDGRRTRRRRRAAIRRLLGALVAPRVLVRPIRRRRAWRAHFLAHAGSGLYAGEAYYTGLVALDPRRSRPSCRLDRRSSGDRCAADQRRRRQLHHELFEGSTTDSGATWEWAAITADSTVDNLRPIIPIWDGDQSALLWLRGVYTDYDDYDLDVVAIITERPAVTPATVAATNVAVGACAAHRAAHEAPHDVGGVGGVDVDVEGALERDCGHHQHETSARHLIHPPDGGWSGLALPTTTAASSTRELTPAW